jgi:hypothetical protein
MTKAALNENADIIVPNILRKSLKGENPIDSFNEDIKAQGTAIHDLFRQKHATYLLYFPFKMIRTSLIEKHGLRFNPAFSLGEDLIFVLSLLEVAECVYCMHEPLYIYNAAFGGLNSSYRPHLADEKFALSIRLKQYLTHHGQFDSGYYRALLRDVFAVAVNERLAQNQQGIHDLLRHPLTTELRTAWGLDGLTVPERLVLLMIKWRLKRLLYLASGLWISRNY